MLVVQAGLRDGSKKGVIKRIVRDDEGIRFEEAILENNIQFSMAICDALTAPICRHNANATTSISVFILMFYLPKQGLRSIFQIPLIFSWRDGFILPLFIIPSILSMNSSGPMHIFYLTIASLPLSCFSPGVSILFGNSPIYSLLCFPIYEDDGIK